MRITSINSFFEVFVIVFIAVIILLLIFSYRGAMLVLKVTRFGITAHPYTFGKKYDSFFTTTTDSVKISGWFLPAESETAIILFHGWGANKSDILPSTIFLNEKFNLVYFDFRNHGESDDAFNSFGVYELRDAMAVYDWLKKNHPEINKIYTWGLSMGGAISILFCALNNIEKGVVESSYYSFNDTLKNYIKRFYKLPVFPFYYTTKFFINLKLGFEPEEFSPKYVKNSTTKFLFLYGEADTKIPISDGMRLKEKFGGNLITVKGADHGQIHEYMKNYKQTLLDFYLY